MTKEWKIGLVSIAIIALFVWVGFFLAGRNILTKENTFYAVFETAGVMPVTWRMDAPSKIESQSYSSPFVDENAEPSRSYMTLLGLWSAPAWTK